MDKFNIIKKEWRFIFLISAVVLLISVFPYLFGYFSTPTDKQFIGVHNINAEDTYSYLAWMQQAREGDFLFKNLYAVEDQQQIIFNPLFFTIGLLAKYSGLPNIVMYHCFRVVLGFFFAVIAYYFIAYFFEEVYKRKVCFLLLLFSSGLGWAARSFFEATDLWMSASITFLTIYESPLLLFSMSLMLLTFLFALLSFRASDNNYAVLAGIAFLLLLVSHFYISLLVAITLIVYQAIDYLLHRSSVSLKQYTKPLVIMLSFALPGVIYLLYVLFSNNVLAQWFSAMDFTSPNFRQYLFGYGIILLLALVGMYQVIRHRLREFLFIIIWCVVCIFLLYQPWLTGLQRKFIEGLHIALIILATIGLFFIIQKKKIYYRKRFLVYLLSFLFISNFFIIMKDIGAYRNNLEPFYISSDSARVINWLEENTDSSDIILARYWLSNFIPGKSGNIVYFGHTYETPNKLEKEERVEWFFKANQVDQKKKEFLKENNIQYVIYEPQDSMNFKAGPFLKLVFQSGEVVVYEVF
jgi:hypothetical protein